MVDCFLGELGLKDTMDNRASEIAAVDANAPGERLPYFVLLPKISQGRGSTIELLCSYYRTAATRSARPTATFTYFVLKRVLREIIMVLSSEMIETSPVGRDYGKRYFIAVFNVCNDTLDCTSHPPEKVP